MNIPIHQSKIEGSGVFASANIRKGKIICLMRGKKVSVARLKKLYDLKGVRIDDPFQISDRTYIILQKPYIYFNHSCDPNAGLIKINTMIALKNIKKGEEITYDYSTTEWSDDAYWGINWQKIWKIQCRCKSKHCRKTIREFPSLPQQLKNKYYKMGLLPSFIIKKVEKK